VSDDTHVLRVILVTQDDPFYLPHFFEPLKAALDRHPDISVRGIVIQRPLGARSTSELARQMLDLSTDPVGFVRMGTRFVWRKAMAIVAVRGFGGRLPGAYSLEHLARRVGWPVLAATDVNRLAFLATIREQQIDLVVSVGASQKFKRPVLEAPRFGCINLHNSKLPRLRECCRRSGRSSVVRSRPDVGADRIQDDRRTWMPAPSSFSASSRWIRRSRSID
jgi:hypothetical protein